jgi:hypothetical protein
MRSTTAICSPSARSGPDRHGLGATRLWLRVLLHRCDFDRDLADGGGAEWEPGLQLRSLQLTRSAERRRLAGCLRKLVEEAETVQRRPPLGPVVPVQREVVLIWRDSIVAIAGRLLRPMPVAAAGMARLRLLLTDGAGPLFNPASEYLMADVLQRIEEDLDPNQGARR